MQDRHKIEGQKKTTNTQTEMQGRNTSGQSKTEQTKEAKIKEQEQKEHKGTAKHH